MVADTPLASATAPWASLAPPPHGSRLLRAADLATLPDDGWLYELVEGRLVRMPPPKGRHGRLESRIDTLLSEFVLSHGLGCVYVGETGFDLTRPGEPDATVLGADVAFVRAERVPAEQDDDAYLPGPPDLAVEIASSSQYRPEMGAKAWLWLQRGTRMVWVVWPRRQEVDVWTLQHEEPSILCVGDQIGGDDVLPGFTLPVAELFGLL